MPGMPVTIGCPVLLNPGPSGWPDFGVISVIPQAVVTAGGMPLATSGSTCAMVNSMTGAPYVVVIGPLASTGVRVAGMALVRAGDQILSPPGVLTIAPVPAAPYVIDRS